MGAASLVQSVPRTARTDWREAWTVSFGARWPLDLTVMALVVFCFGAVRPLADPDLPMHLALGEWIVRHRAVPFVEPFAWTRAGAPYFAYSWLPQSLFYLVFDAFGHVGLRALQGLFVLGGAASMVALARAAHWRPSQAIIMAGLNLIVAAFFVAMLRPQSVLLITIPLAWAAFLRITDDEAIATPALVLFVASAVTANSHLFFPLTLAPAALLVVRPPRQRAHAVIGVACVVAGWFASPYSLRWLEVFRHNFAPNILMRPPSAVTELQPGFVTMLYPKPGPMIGIVLMMLAIPWVLGRSELSRRERVLSAVYWAGGLVLFGYAARLFMVWWLLAIVPVGWAVAVLTRDTSEAPPRLRFRLLGVLACLLVIVTEAGRTSSLWAMEGNTTHRVLPTQDALPSEQLAQWLDANTIAGAKARLATTFSYGSYLTWRLPGYSASIDSRGIFPDSVLAAEAVVQAWNRDLPIEPLATADVAIIPLGYRAAAVLDTAAVWHRVATVPGSPDPTDSTGLWVRRAWLEHFGRRPPTR
jgi:hypothetical protein